MQYDVIVIGAGPGGIFSAYELTELKKDLKIAVFEAGNPLHKRKCPIDGVKVKSCIGCKSCSIMSGFGGAGAFSDGKLSLSHEVGGDLPSLVGEDLAQETINYADQIYLEPLTVETIKRIIKKEKPDGILLAFGGQTALNCGTELYLNGTLERHGVKVLGTSVEAIMITEDRDLFVKKLNEIDAKTPVSQAVESMEDAVEANETFAKLMGDDPELRREFIENNAKLVTDLDI